MNRRTFLATVSSALAFIGLGKKVSPSVSEPEVKVISSGVCKIRTSSPVQIGNWVAIEGDYYVRAAQPGDSKIIGYALNNAGNGEVLEIGLLGSNEQYRDQS